MSRTRERWKALSEQLKHIDPARAQSDEAARDRLAQGVRARVAVEDVRAAEGRERWRPARVGSRGFVLAVVALAAVVVAIVALSPGDSDPVSPQSALAAAADAAAEQDRPELADEEFIYRRSLTWRPAVPGVLFSGEDLAPMAEGVDSEVEHEIWLNYTGGGHTDTRVLEPPREQRDCTQGQVLLGFIVDGFGGCQAMRAPMADLPLFDERLELRRGPFDPPQLGRTGSGVDELPTDPTALGVALDAEAERLAGEIANTGSLPEPGAFEDSAKLEVVGGVLANPTATPELRSAAFDYAERIEGIRAETGVIDPVGREGTSVSLTEPARYGQINFSYPGGGGLFDLSHEGTELERELIFDPESSDVLATRISLISTRNAVLEPWLEAEGPPATVGYEVYETPEVVSRPDLVLERVECPYGSTMIQPEGSIADCPTPIHPSLRDEFKAAFEGLQDAETEGDRSIYEARLDELQARSEELYNRGRPGSDDGE